ncbi:MAG: exonuclease SbcCD subunit D C-terminal domain-containing protein [Bacteroidota bacterium]
MKILHTSDWHLGQRLLQLDRHEEFRLVLEWLLDLIEEEQIEVLLVAGDIFDIGNPPNQSRQLYYNFLRQILKTDCRHVVITGGNHDSPAMLNAPRELLEGFNIYVLGSATDDIGEELLHLKNDQGELELIIAAVPFLRDRDLRVSRVGESEQSRQDRLQTGLTEHYRQLAQLAEDEPAGSVPVIAMGHLYAKGAVAADRQDNIYLGNRENMEAGQFPLAFDYVALGHIHRAQLVGKNERVRYSGSLIPLSFSETKDEKQVWILQTDGKEITAIDSHSVPTFRRLKTIQGTLEKVQKGLERFAANEERLLTPWVEVIVESENFIPQLDQVLRDFCAEMPLELVKIRINRPYVPIQAQLEESPDLEAMEVEDVFLQKCHSLGIEGEEQLGELVTTFRELQNWLQEQEQ